MNSYTYCFGLKKSLKYNPIIDKTITYKGQLGAYKIYITQSDRFSTCTKEELQNSPLVTDITMAMPEGFNLRKVPAIIPKAKVLEEDQSKLQLELNHTSAFSSPEALLDDLLQKEAEQMYPDAKITGYSTRTCNHFKRKHCLRITINERISFGIFPAENISSYLLER